MNRYTELDYKRIGERIRELRADESQGEFARKFGLSQVDISRIERGEVKPTPELLYNICIKYARPMAWLLTGEGSMRPEMGVARPIRVSSGRGIDPDTGERLYMVTYDNGAVMPTTESDVESLLNVSPGKVDEWLEEHADGLLPSAVSLVAEQRAIYNEAFIPVRMVRGEISAGGGLLPDNTIEMRVAFRRDWIQRKGDPSNMSIIRVQGDSMEPTLMSGDIVLVDHGRNFIDPWGGIYALVSDSRIMIKRLQVLSHIGKIRVISDNQKYEPYVVSPDQLVINGKVIWFGREIER